MKTLLDAVNDVLMRASIIGMGGALPSLTDSAKQPYIDLAVQVWNEVTDETCNLMGVAHAGETGSSDITLVAGTREYALPSNLVQIRWPLLDETNGYIIEEYPGGYEAMRIEQSIPDEWEGLPNYAVVNPTTGYLRMDRIPTADDAGIVYKIFYDKDLALSLAADVVPFSDAVYRGLVPVVTELWERRKRNDFDVGEARRNLARAVAFANKANRRDHW